MVDALANFGVRSLSFQLSGFRLKYFLFDFLRGKVFMSPMLWPIFDLFIFNKGH